MPVVEQQAQSEPVPMAAVPQGQPETQQPTLQEGMTTDPSSLRGGGEGGDVCCGVCAGLACFECLECCC